MKVSEKDKILLVVLAIVLVVALAVVMPGFGVLDARTKIEETQTEIDEVDNDIAKELEELRDMGITSSEDAKNVKLSIRRLEERVHDEMVEAARLADIVMPYLEGYNVEKGWLNSVRYIGMIPSTEEEDFIIDYNDVEETDKNANNETVSIKVDDIDYSIEYTRRGIDYRDTETTKIEFALEYAFEDMNEERFGALILYLQQATAKGSIYITRATYDAMEKSGVIELDALMTANSDLLSYAKQLEAEAAAQEETEE